MEELDMVWLPVYRSWRLNERHYGALQGLSKKDTAQEFGEEQVLRWRRSYKGRPPGLALEDERHPRWDPRYVHLQPEEVAAAESLKDTLERVLPYWHEVIAPALKHGRKVLVSAHGNSLRALVKYLDHISDEEIPNLNIPTGIPLVYEPDDDLQAVGHYYLGDAEKIQEATSSVAAQAVIRKVELGQA
jgi:2,3-bisphosphoglycerate-dependent phosphoglycerate mutase